MVPVKVLRSKDINFEVIRADDLGPKVSVPCITSWTLPIFQYLKYGSILENEKHKRTFEIKSSKFNIIERTLLKKSTVSPYVRCLEDDEAKIILKEIHKGECGNHTWGMPLFSKIQRSMYYWPTMKKDAIEYAQKRDACQTHNNILHQPAEPLHPINSPWPFMRRGIDIIGKLPTILGCRVFLFELNDYFSTRSRILCSS